MSNPVRYFPNPKLGTTQLSSNLQINTENIPHIIKDIWNHCLKSTKNKSYIYTGDCGLAYANLKLYQATFKDFSNDKINQLINDIEIQNKAYNEAIDRINQSIHQRPSRSPGAFFCGDAGVFCTAALIYAPFLDTREEFEKYKNKYLELSKEAIDTDPYKSTYENSYELLYGRTGYLIGLLMLKPYTEILIEMPKSIITSILDFGIRFSKSIKHPCPLYYEWPSHHPSPYLGAAHGIIGIMYILLHYINILDQIKNGVLIVKDTIDYILSIECNENGQMMGPYGWHLTKLDSRKDPLVHWCHGSTGAVYLFCKAYEVFGEEKYKGAAERAGEVIWQYGLLRKGPGLCHGISGNGYALLYLFKILKNEIYYHRAMYFGEFMVSEQFKEAYTPDNPYSLYEGWSGALCFYLDLLDPLESKFPFFEF